MEVNRAAAVAMAFEAQAGLDILLQLENHAESARQVARYYPYHAARADLLRRTSQRQAAAQAYKKALNLCGSNAERAYLRRRLDQMHNSF